MVEGLPVHTFHTDEGDVAMKCPTEVADHRPARERTGRPGLRSAGALQGHRLRGVLQRADRARKPKKYDNDAANANARLSAQIPLHPGRSRFAHYLKAMMRDKIGSFMSRAECERSSTTGFSIM